MDDALYDVRPELEKTSLLSEPPVIEKPPRVKVPVVSELVESLSESKVIDKVPPVAPPPLFRSTLPTVILPVPDSVIDASLPPEEPSPLTFGKVMAVSLASKFVTVTVDPSPVRLNVVIVPEPSRSIEPLFEVMLIPEAVDIVSSLSEPPETARDPISKLPLRVIFSLVPSLLLSTLSVSEPVPPESGASYKSTAAMLIPPSELIVKGSSFAEEMVAPTVTPLFPLESSVTVFVPSPLSTTTLPILVFNVMASPEVMARAPEASISTLAKF